MFLLFDLAFVSFLIFGWAFFLSIFNISVF